MLKRSEFLKVRRKGEGGKANWEGALKRNGATSFEEFHSHPSVLEVRRHQAKAPSKAKGKQKVI